MQDHVPMLVVHLSETNNPTTLSVNYFFSSDKSAEKTCKIYSSIPSDKVVFILYSIKVCKAHCQMLLGSGFRLGV